MKIVTNTPPKLNTAHILIDCLCLLIQIDLQNNQAKMILFSTFQWTFWLWDRNMAKFGLISIHIWQDKEDKHITFLVNPNISNKKCCFKFY